MEPNPGLSQTGVSESLLGLGTFGLLKAARGTSDSGRLCELPLGPPAHRAAILLTCCLHFVLGLLLSRASHPLTCCLPSGGVGEARAASRVAAGPLSGLAPLGPSHPPLTCGWSGARRSAVGIFRESRRAAAPPERPESGHFSQVSWGLPPGFLGSSGLSVTNLFFQISLPLSE